MKKIAILIILFCFVAAFAHSTDGENLTLRIALIGQGDELWFWFGHIALIIEDSLTGRSYMYDYGIFSMDYDNFFTNFAMGNLLFTTGRTPTNIALEHYRRINRSVVIYTLDVPPETRAKIRDQAERDMLIEYYYYHHFLDNCATRIRDLIDMMTGGQFYEQFGNEPGRFTLRQHVRRHTWAAPFVDWILNFWMGQVIDRPTTVWEEMFLPSEVAKRIRDFTYIDIHGVERQLVVGPAETISLPYGRPGVMDYPPPLWPRLLIFSLVLSAIFGLLFFMQSKKIAAGKVLAGISMSVAGLVFGFAGLLLYFLNISTSIYALIDPAFLGHDYTLQNFNMLFATPLLLAAFPLGICYAAAKKPDRQIRVDFWLRLLWVLVVLGILVSMLLQLLPGVFQQNLPDQLLMLPIALIFSLRPWGLKEVLQKYVCRNCCCKKKSKG